MARITEHEASYTLMHRMKHQAVISYNKRNESEYIGFGGNFVPTCVLVTLVYNASKLAVDQFKAMLNQQQAV